jgi:hypothetical protein
MLADPVEYGERPGNHLNTAEVAASALDHHDPSTQALAYAMPGIPQDDASAASHPARLPNTGPSQEISYRAVDNQGTSLHPGSDMVAAIAEDFKHSTPHLQAAVVADLTHHRELTARHAGS